MAKAFPCPNPTCSHVFSPQQLQGAEIVQCPKCGFRLKGTGSAKSATPLPKPLPPTSKPVAKPKRPLPPGDGSVDVELVELPTKPQVPLAPVAKPVMPASPLPASPVSEFHDPEPVHEQDEGPLVKVRKRKRGWNVKGLLTVFGAISMAALVVGGGGYYVIFELLLKKEGASNVLGRDVSTVTFKSINQRKQAENVFKFVFSDKDWQADRDLKTQFNALGAFRHRRDPISFAVAVKDYGMQRPRDSELIEGALEKLTQYFQSSDSYEAGAKSEPSEFAGFKTQKLTFKGVNNAVTLWGFCHMFSQNGFAYWCYFVGPSLDELLPYEELLAKDGVGFSTLTERRGWREQPPEFDQFNAKGSQITVSGPKSVWMRATSPDIEYESGILYLTGIFMKEKDNQKNATFQIFTLDKQTDLKEGLKAAKAFIEQKKQDENSNYKVALADEAAGIAGVAQDIGNRPGRLVELKFLLGEGTPSRYLLVGAFTEGEKTYVVRCDCTWVNRQIWRQDFLDLMKTLKVHGGGEAEK